MTTTHEITTNTLAGWFGSDRMVAKMYADAIGKVDWIAVPFCGGCSMMQHIKTRAGVACDRHRHIVNLARVVADKVLVEQLVDAVELTLFHPDELRHAQERCKNRESRDSFMGGEPRIPSDKPSVQWAADYFICCWMIRGGFAGKRNEFEQKISTRYGSSGGDSAVRKQSAAMSLRGWNRALCERWSFSTEHAFDLLGRVKDVDGHAIYADAPWPDDGDEYRHQFSDDEHRELARLLSSHRHVRTVVRFGDHPLIRELYPESQWKWTRHESRSQGNNAVAEVMLTKGGR